MKIVLIMAAVVALTLGALMLSRKVGYRGAVYARPQLDRLQKN